MAKKDLSFEKAMEELEEIIDKLEANELSLEESMKAFDRSQNLIKFCEEQLQTAEKKLKLIPAKEK